MTTTSVNLIKATGLVLPSKCRESRTSKIFIAVDYLYIYLSIYLSIYPSIHLSIHLYIYQPIQTSYPTSHQSIHYTLKLYINITHAHPPVQKSLVIQESKRAPKAPPAQEAPVIRARNEERRRRKLLFIHPSLSHQSHTCRPRTETPIHTPQPLAPRPQLLENENSYSYTPTPRARSQLQHLHQSAPTTARPPPRPRTHKIPAPPPPTPYAKRRKAPMLSGPKMPGSPNHPSY